MWVNALQCISLRSKPKITGAIAAELGGAWLQGNGRGKKRERGGGDRKNPNGWVLALRGPSFDVILLQVTYD